MATKNNSLTNGCTFCWKIENVSHCWLKKGESIMSPSFIADALEATKWQLELYPMGYKEEKEVSLFLHRRRDCLRTGAIEVSYQLAFLDKDGLFLKVNLITKRSFTKGGHWGFDAFELREKVFVSEKKSYIPEDTLTVQCTICKKEETICKPIYSHARTTYKVNSRYFVWKIHEFSTLKTDTRYKFIDDLIDFDLDLNKMTHFTKKLDISIISFDESIKYFSFKAFILNSYGDKEECGAHEYLAGDLVKGVLSMPIFSKMLTENNARYLPNDALTLYCEYVSSNGAVSNEFFSCGIISSNVTKAVDEQNHKRGIEKEKPRTLPVLVNDLKSMYNDGTLSDIELRTETQTFSAHKTILGARSPVFRRMFSNDMKENNSGHIDISDLENDTIHRMLLYMYTDIVEDQDLQLENGCKLYSAADKYEILSLKNRCSSFLKDSLCLTKACDVLVLADLHNDDDLKRAVQDYILKHDKEVFGSQEWKHFMVTNIQLAADVMYKKVFPG